MKVFGLGLALILATGCGDLFMGDKGDNKVSFTSGASCDSDTSKFSEILTSNIGPEIDCLNKQLHSFIELVRTDRPGSISERTLIEFIQDGPIDIGDPTMIPIIEGIFDLTHVIFGGDRGYVSRKQLDALMAFLVKFNENIVPVYNKFESDQEPGWGDYQRNRRLVRRHFITIASELRSLMNMGRTKVDRLSINLFLDRFFKDDLATADQIKDFMFLKEMFLGGTSEELTHLELEKALIKLPDLGEIAYDLIKVGSFGFKDEPQRMIDLIYLPTIRNVERNLHYAPGTYEPLFTVHELVKALGHLDLVGIDFSKYTQEITELKRVFFSDPGPVFTNADITVLLSHLQNILDEGSVFYRIYQAHDTDEYLRNRGPITAGLPNFTPNNDQERIYRDHFGQIISSYRFFKGTAKSPLFGLDYDRNFLGVFEIAGFEYAVKLLMSAYGEYNQMARGGYHMTLNETVDVMDVLKRLLRDEGIVRVGKAYGGEVQAAADNVVLMSTLFQYQSDGCVKGGVCMEVPEITEFLIGLFTAMNFRDFFTEEMKKACDGYADNYSSERTINPECFRREFKNVLEAQNPADDYKSISNYMPLLTSFLKEMTQDLGDDEPATNSEGYTQFLLETEAFTRTCEYWDDEGTEPVFLNGDDAFSVFAGMINIESTLIRFDLDYNNKLDYKNLDGVNEVINAFNTTYRGAIEGMMKGELGSLYDIVKFLDPAKIMFQYLVKKGEVPSIGQILKFIFAKKNADATRTSVATILKILGEQNAGENYFKCQECLDRECVPQKCVKEGDQFYCEDDPWD